MTQNMIKLANMGINVEEKLCKNQFIMLVIAYQEIAFNKPYLSNPIIYVTS